MIAADVLRAARINAFGDHLFVKEPGSDVETPWHHDQPYFSIAGRQMCTTWIALDPTTPTTGALRYVKGLHKWPQTFRRVQFQPSDRLFADPDQHALPDIDDGSFEILSWDLEPGDCLVHHCRTVHGARGNGARDVARRAYAPRFVGEDMVWQPRAPQLTKEQKRKSAWPVNALPDLCPGDPLDHDQAIFPRLWTR